MMICSTNLYLPRRVLRRNGTESEHHAAVHFIPIPSSLRRAACKPSSATRFSARIMTPWLGAHSITASLNAVGRFHVNKRRRTVDDEYAHEYTNGGELRRLTADICADLAPVDPNPKPASPRAFASENHAALEDVEHDRVMRSRSPDARFPGGSLRGRASSPACRSRAVRGDQRGGWRPSPGLKAEYQVDPQLGTFLRHWTVKGRPDCA